MNVQATTTRFFEARGEQVLGTWSSRDPVADQHCVDQPLSSASTMLRLGSGQQLHSGRRLVVV
jgi:hypothetical protein